MLCEPGALARRIPVNHGLRPKEAYIGNSRRSLQCYKVASGVGTNAVEGKNHPEAGRLLHFSGCELPRITIMRRCVGASVQGYNITLHPQRLVKGVDN